jgi:Domain of unknown function (DUF3303)
MLGGQAMKFLLTWELHAGGSHADCEAAQKRILDIFQAWKIPESLKFERFLASVAGFRGYAIVETDNPIELHKAATIFAGFKFNVDPVIDVEQAVPAELEAIAWRASVK